MQLTIGGIGMGKDTSNSWTSEEGKRGEMMTREWRDMVAILRFRRGKKQGASGQLPRFVLHTIRF